MQFFQTPDVSVIVEDIIALSKQGSSLNIHLRNGSVVKSLEKDADWGLIKYTQQWANLLEPPESEEK